MKAITIFEIMDVSTLPPVQNLIRVLLAQGRRVDFIGNNLASLSLDIRNHPGFKGHEYTFSKKDSHPRNLPDKVRAYHSARRLVDECMRDSDILWTTSLYSAVVLYNQALKYQNVMQLLELQKCAYTLHGHLKIKMDDIARRSWKVVCVEENRAYIQKLWWNLQKTPAVLPNKPFNLDYGNLTPDVKAALARMKAEPRRIILYLGVLGSDRELTPLAKAIQKLDDCALYIAGRYENGETVETLEQQYGAVYLGSFLPPQHLALLEETYIGLLPYKPNKSAYSELNALYCAPNKIWEYAGFGVPMVGSDVLGLKLPFEQWNIGRCCELSNEAAIIDAIRYVDAHHDELSGNCYKFYDSVDLGKTVSDILED